MEISLTLTADIELLPKYNSSRHLQQKKFKINRIYHKTIFKHIHKSTINNTKYFHSDMR